MSHDNRCPDRSLLLFAMLAAVGGVQGATHAIPPSEWQVPPGTGGWSTSEPSCVDWMVRERPIEEIIRERFPKTTWGTECQGAVWGQAAMECPEHQVHNGAYIRLMDKPGLLPCTCSSILPRASYEIGDTLDSLARDTLDIRCLATPGNLPVKVAILAEGTISIVSDLTRPISCDGCASASAEASLKVTSTLPWSWVTDAINKDGRLDITHDARHCVTGGGGATFGLNGEVGLTGPAVGASVQFPAGPNGVRMVTRLNRKLIVYARGCAVPPSVSTDYELAMEAKAIGSTALDGGDGAELRVKAKIEKLEFRFLANASSSDPTAPGCNTCGSTDGVANPVLEDPPSP